MSPAEPLAYQTYGVPDGRPLVLIHGIATSCELWAPQIPSWGARHRIVAVDLPGHGRTPADPDCVTLNDFALRVEVTLNALNVSAAAVVGLSLGGMVAQALAITKPQRVTALVLAHTSGRTPAEAVEMWEGRCRAVAENGIESQLDQTLSRWFTPLFLQRAPLHVAWISRLIRATSAQGFEIAARAICQLDHLDLLQAIDVPALVIQGDADQSIPLSAAEALANAFPRGRLTFLKNAAHLGNVEQPVDFAEVVGHFLNGSRSGR